MDKIVIEKLGEDKLDRYNEVYVLDGINLRKKWRKRLFKNIVFCWKSL